MKQQKEKRTVFMTGPAQTVQGGIRTVVNQYLSETGWKTVTLRHIPTHIEGSAPKKALFFGVQFLRLLALAAVEKPEIIHMHVSERGSFWRKSLILRTFRRLGVKTVLHHHGAEFFSFYDESSEANRKRIAKTVALADVNLVLSRYHCRMMEQRFPGGTFRVLYNAVPLQNGEIYDPDGTRILFVGRLGQRKGTYDLIAALEELDDVLPPEIKVCFCGDGETDQVAALLRQKKLEHRVAHIGWCARETLTQFYRQAVLFILPSYHEGLPMSLLEAMYAGIPCVSTNVDGIPELIVSGQNGLLVEPGNGEQIKSALLDLIRDRQLRQTLGKNGCRTVAQQFSMKTHVETLEAIYLELEGERK